MRFNKSINIKTSSYRRTGLVPHTWARINFYLSERLAFECIKTKYIEKYLIH